MYLFICRLGSGLVGDTGAGGVRAVCEKVWLHLCVERERVERTGQVVKWQRVEMSGLFEEEVECSLCCRLYYRPTVTPCGHTLCEPCLNRYL